MIYVPTNSSRESARLKHCNLILAFKSMVDNIGKCVWHGFPLYVQQSILCLVDRPALNSECAYFSRAFERSLSRAKTNLQENDDSII
jgi:hypothetical protein